MDTLLDLGFGHKKKKRKRRLTKSLKEEVASSQGWKCADCGKLLEAQLYHVDHKKPLSEGGSDSKRNLQALCVECHAKKTKKERLKKARRRIKDAEEKDNSPFSFGPGSHRKKSQSLFDLSSGKKPSSKKNKDAIDWGASTDLFGSKKKRKKKKGPFDF